MDESSNVAEESQTTLPISRVRTIMKSSPDVSNIGQDALLVMTKATVSFFDLSVIVPMVHYVST